MGSDPPSTHSNNARDMFAAGVDYYLAFEWLVQARRKNGTPEFRMIGPMIVLASFGCELFFKSLLTDSGATTIPQSHDLEELSRNLPRLVKSSLVKQWIAFLKRGKRIPHTPKERDFNSAVAAVGESFVEWRYRFERTPSLSNFRDPVAFILMAFLQDFILRKHPEWEDKTRAHFVSTFPTP